VAVLVTGVALYLSRGVLDHVVTSAGVRRVALLPPWQALVGSLVLAALGLLWLHHLAVPRGTSTAVRPPLALLTLPSLAFPLLWLPYLPVVADAIPVLRVLAGPLVPIAWMVVLAQLAWVWWSARVIHVDRLTHITLSRATLGIGLATTVVAGAAAGRLAGTVLYPGGDEPHYLVIAQSLWRDGDLRIQNNHQRRDYGEYFAHDLEPHDLTRGADAEIYSIHPIGMPVLMAPVYAAGGYPAVVAAMVLLSATAAALMWRGVAIMTGAAGIATFGWAAVALTAPFLFNAFAVYPEVPAALAAVVAWTHAAGLWKGEGARRWLPVGLASAALPWLSTKYAPMSAALVAIAVTRVLWPQSVGLRSAFAGLTRSWQTSRLSAVAVVVVPYAASLAGWFSVFQWIWGTPWPQAPYGGLVQTEISNLAFGVPGLLFDQEYGLLAYAPVQVLAGVGLWRMWRSGGESARQAGEIVVTFAALLATVGAFRIWWGGSAAPGRPLTSGLLLLALPIGVAFRAAPSGSARRAAHHVLLWLSLGVAGLLAMTQDGFLTTNGRDGSSSLLEYLSPHWPLWSALPSFILHTPLTALTHTVVWLAILAAAAAALARTRARHSGTASLTAITAVAVTVGAALMIVPRLPASPAWPAVDLDARPRLAVLDEYDAVARPVGVEYSPLRVIDAATAVTHATLTVTSGQRSVAQPLRVIHNGRLSLPAGRYRLDVEWREARSGDVLGLQIGRFGAPWLTWPVEPRAGDRWSSTFELPLDAGFVGLRGSAEIERAISRFAVTPLSVVDAAKRPRVSPVVAASRGTAVSYFFADDNAIPEAQGFWVRGSRSTRVTIHRDQVAGPLRLRVHSGLVDNRLHVAMPGWGQTLTLAPGHPAEIDIPFGDRVLTTLDLTAEREFVPRQVDPASRDPRPLGVWIEVMPE
jgi:hypothetical protein